MTYTFWHSGILIGESDLEQPSDQPRQRGGVFRPTAYGREVFPRLTGILTAGHALKTYLDANGLTPEAMEKGEIEEFFDRTAAGQKIIDIGRMLSEVEMRAPDGRRQEIASIAFSDQVEVQRLVHEMNLATAYDPTEWPPDVARYIVTATLQDNTPPSSNAGYAGPFQHRHWSQDN